MQHNNKLTKARKMIQKGHIGFLAHVASSAKIKTPNLKDILVIQNFLVEFSDEL